MHTDFEASPNTMVETSGRWTSIDSIRLEETNNLLSKRFAADVGESFLVIVDRETVEASLDTVGQHLAFYQIILLTNGMSYS